MKSISLPTFFFSHARIDRDGHRYLDHFFEDIEQRVAQLSGKGVRVLGTIDRRIEQATNWDANLSGHLAADHCLVAIYSPTFFNREDCGKELYVFLLRHPEVGIDPNGALTGITNVLAIRWESEQSYQHRPMADGRIPTFLALIQDTPADPGGDRIRSNAISRYRRKGMRACVRSPGYNELLDLFANRLIDMEQIPRAEPLPSFATAKNAFTHDWRAHFQAPAGTLQASIEDISQPQPYSSMVVLYWTKRSVSAGFAIPNQMEGHELPIANAEGDRELEQLVSAVTEAAVRSALVPFHAVVSGWNAISSILENCRAQNILTILAVDSLVWPNVQRGGTGEGRDPADLLKGKFGPDVLIAPAMGSGAVAPTADDINVPMMERLMRDANRRLIQSVDRTPPDGADPMPVLRAAMWPGGF